jgi:prepilin-type N-terminal cleavage/methylation domain-containing protein
MARLMKSEKGFTLIEVLLALALLGMIATTFLMAISTAAKAIMIADERTIAESLARSQMEYVKEQDYKDVYYEINIDDYPSFSIWSKDEVGGVVEEIVGVPLEDGLQKIELVIKNNDKEVLTLEGYKVDEGVY